MTLKWQGTNQTLILDPAYGYTLMDAEGILGFPSIRVKQYDLPLGGGKVAQVFPRARTVLLKVHAHDDTKRSDFLSAMTVGAEGTLVYEGSETRTLDCKVVGLEEEFRPVSGGIFIVRMLAEWPWWAGPSQTKVFSQAARPLFFPVPPVYVVSGAVYSEEVVVVDGNGDTFPSFTITGPCDYVVLENRTLGLRLQVNAALTTGEKRKMNFRPPATVEDDAGENRMSEIQGYFWPLVPGPNQIRILAPGASDDTQVVMSWEPAHAGAW